MDSITIQKPDDWHAHLRDGAMLKAVLPFHAKRFGRAIIMPNLSPNPVITTAHLEAYRARIMSEIHGENFIPLMTYYLTEQSSPKEIGEGFRSGLATAVKLYPANATTNSSLGVTDIQKVYSVLEEMQKIHMPILLHGETVQKDGKPIDPIDRESVFLDTTLPKLLKDFPELKIVLEHATSKNAIDFVRNENSSRLASTITAHHLLVNHSDIERSDMPQYLQCMPVIKSVADQKALREAATSGDSHFFLGTDSAPHPVSAKEKVPPASGVFTAPAAVELYAQVFEEEGKLENFEAFASLNGAKFYGLDSHTETMTLTRTPWTIDDLITTDHGEKIRPYGYDEHPEKRTVLNWKIAP